MKKKKFFNERKERIKLFLQTVYEILKRKHMAILPGQLAFFLILSIVPIITLIGYGASFFDISVDTIIEALRNNFSPEVVKTVVPILSGNSMDLKYAAMMLVMLFFASNGADSIIITANEIYGIKQQPYIKRRVKALFMTFLIVLLYLFILIVPVLGKGIIDTIDYFNLKTIITTIISIIRGPISWFIIFIFIKTIFTIAPNKHIPASQINIGAAFTSIGWVITTYIYSYYASHFAQYDIFYAGLSNIAVLMLWFYFLSCILVIGLSLTTTADEKELEKTGIIKKAENKDEA